jgi:hypothetical protein
MKHAIKLIFSTAVFLGSALAQAPAEAKPAKASLFSDARIYIPPMNGFENYLTSALASKKVPLTVVLGREQADFVVKGSWRETNGGTSGNGSIIAPLKRRTNYSCSMAVVDPKSSAIVMSYAVQRSGTHDLSKEVAEDWAAKILKEISGSLKR